jgi:hypothetical protein
VRVQLRVVLDITRHRPETPGTPAVLEVQGAQVEQAAQPRYAGFAPQED